MASQRDIARAHWGNAQKIRADILAKLSNSTKERGPVNYTTRFEEAEQIISEFRLACMNVIFHDFEYAVARRVENSLWQSHVFMNGEYRKALGRLNTPNQVVQRRKLDKLYRDFLKTSGEFYIGYIQRLHQRFSIPELQQIARKMKAQPAEQPVDNVSHPAPLRAMVLKSCQMTLVHMGDLARYRCQLSDKFSKTTFEKAADYYGLANSLDPDDGSAHHQLAVLHQIPGQHFDIVYHFHRAIAVARPHELALSNLEREFKSPESSSQAKKGPSKDQSQAMLTWFVRLHAFFFHGKNFSQQSELEEEVLHRAEVALRRGDPDDKILLKMILVNIAAYDISTEKVKSSWTMEGSQSCQFLLRFNIRMMLVLLRTLHRTLHDDSATVVSADNRSNDGESCITFSPGLLTLLPLFRLYIAWSYVTRADLVQYQEYLEPHITDLYRLLAEVLTSLSRYIDPALETVSSKYLLPEDSEAQGLRPLGDRKLPLFLHVEEQRSSIPPKRAKVRKPHKNVFGREFKRETEAVWRIRDIICCGLFLAGSAKFPIVMTTLTDQGRDTEEWVFADGTTAPLSSNEASLSRLLNKLGFGDMKSSSQILTEPEISQVPAESEISQIPAESEISQIPKLPEIKKPEANRTKIGPIPTPVNDRKATLIALDDTSHKNNGKSLDKSSTNYLESDLLEDDDMVNMVNKLLDPVDDVCPPLNQAQVEASYGMHSSTAMDVFGNLETSPIQPSPVAKTIPYLPWDFVYKPTPHRTNSQDQDQSSPNGHNVPRSASRQLNGHTPSSYLDDLSASYHQLHPPNTLSPRLNTGYLQASPIPMASSPALSRKGHGLDTLEDSRNAVLDSLRSALLAQHGLTPNSPSPGSNMRDVTSTTPVWGQGNGMTETPFPQAGGSTLERSSDHRVNTVNLQNSLGPPGQGRPELGQTASTISGSRFIAPTKSTNFNSQHIWGQGQGSSRYRPHNSTWENEPLTAASSLAFSHPSSLISGTPDPVATAPANSVACNGHYYNATTPFGRLGDGVNNRADPTHFRNQLKAAIGTSELSYDQQILQAAMMDTDRKPRPK
ncbi:hypothetical protein F4859DRAFT_314904 [Xylaria cf. heliscus]|nr:hypothetical protein F4859DRAFT_314904 [Xylaria cf. heliscus]